MSVKKTKEKIAVMQAYIDGKEIECSRLDDIDYFSVTDIVWNWDMNTYRIKQPRWKDITINEALDLLKTGPKRARFSDDNRDWHGVFTQCLLTGVSLYPDTSFIYKYSQYKYCQILE